MTPLPVQFLLLLFVGWVSRSQPERVENLEEENRVLREQLGGKRLRFTDARRRRLASRTAVGLALGLTALACAGINGGPDDVAPDAEPAKWNEVDLLQWVDGLAEPGSPYDDLDSVAEFERLQRSIEAVKQMVLAEARTEQEAVEGLRMVLKHLTVATHDWVNNDYRNPLFAKFDPRNRDIGAYNPDAEYDQALIDGRYDYKVSGDLGTVPYVSLTVNGRGGSQRSRSLVYLDDAAIRAHADERGRFTLWLTKQRPDAPGAWVALPDEANGVVIRQYVSDRETQRLARFAIEAVGDPLPEVEITSDADVASRLDRVASYLLVSSTWHRTLLPQMRERPNTFVPSTGSAIGASAANAENYYQMAYFEIGEGERLLVDLDPPEAVYWNLTSASIWHESQRYLTDPVSLTSDEVTFEADGHVRFVIAREDPGHPNWIKTSGHSRGFLILRIVGVEFHPLPTVTRVP
jgi:hypothetical protein